MKAEKAASVWELIKWEREEQRQVIDREQKLLAGGKRYCENASTESGG